VGIRLLTGLTGLVLVFAVGCGGSSAPSASTPAPGASVAAPTGAAPATPAGPAAAASCSSDAVATGGQIAMEGTHSLNPSDLTIKAGETVTWTNKSPNANHQLVFDGGPACPITLVGKATSIKFDTPGSFHYVCKIHPGFMQGTITVQ